MSYGPTMQWLGSSDPEQKSGKVTFFYLNTGQEISFELPDFATAFSLDKFIQSVYQGGKVEGAKIVQFAVQNAMKEVIK